MPCLAYSVRLFESAEEDYSKSEYTVSRSRVILLAIPTTTDGIDAFIRLGDFNDEIPYSKYEALNLNNTPFFLH